MSNRAFNPRRQSMLGRDMEPARLAGDQLTSQLVSSAHNLVLPIHQANLAFTNMAAGEIAENGTPYFVDLTHFEAYQIHAWHYVVGINGSKMYLQYTTTLDGSGGWVSLSSTYVDIGNLTVPRMRYSSVATWPEEARKPVILRIAHSGGDGVADPAVRQIGVTFFPKAPPVPPAP